VDVLDGRRAPVTEELGTMRREITISVPAHSVGALVLRPSR